MWLRHALLEDGYGAGFEDVLKKVVRETDQIRFDTYGILAIYLQILANIDDKDPSLQPCRSMLGKDFFRFGNVFFSTEKGRVNENILCFGAVKQAVSLAVLRGRAFDLYPGPYPHGLDPAVHMRLAAKEYFDVAWRGSLQPYKYYNGQMSTMLASEIETTFDLYMTARLCSAREGRSERATGWNKQ